MKAIFRESIREQFVRWIKKERSTAMQKIRASNILVTELEGFGRCKDGQIWSDKQGECVRIREAENPGGWGQIPLLQDRQRFLRRILAINEQTKIAVGKKDNYNLLSIEDYLRGVPWPQSIGDDSIEGLKQSEDIEKSDSCSLKF